MQQHLLQRNPHKTKTKHMFEKQLFICYFYVCFRSFYPETKTDLNKTYKFTHFETLWVTECKHGFKIKWFVKHKLISVLTCCFSSHDVRWNLVGFSTISNNTTFMLKLQTTLTIYWTTSQNCNKKSFINYRLTALWFQVKGLSQREKSMYSNVRGVKMRQFKQNFYMFATNFTEQHVSSLMTHSLKRVQVFHKRSKFKAWSRVDPLFLNKIWHFFRWDEINFTQHCMILSVKTKVAVFLFNLI